MAKKKKDLTMRQVVKLAEAGKLVGEYENIPEHVYHNGPGFSRSDLSHLLQSPDHWQESIKRNKESKSDALILGSALHSCVLEPPLFKKGYKKIPATINMRTNKGKEEFAELQESSPKATWLKATDFDSVIAMGAAFKRHPICAEFLDGSLKEVTYYWIDKDTGLLCKARIDIVHPILGAMDLKTTKDSAMRGPFGRACVNYNYDLQAGHYWKALAVSKGVDVPFHFGVIEKAKPHGIVVHKADLGLIECGLDIQVYLLQKLDDFLNERIPSGYPIKISNLGLPLYGMDLETRLDKEWK